MKDDGTIPEEHEEEIIAEMRGSRERRQDLGVRVELEEC